MALSGGQVAQVRGDHPCDGLWALAGTFTGSRGHLQQLIQIMLKIKEGSND